MSKFPSIHCSDLGNLKRALQYAGFKSEPLAQDEVVRRKHPDGRIAIAYRQPKHNPFQRINPVARAVWDEYQLKTSKG
jgi:hypothetical protein